MIIFRFSVPGNPLVTQYAHFDLIQRAIFGGASSHLLAVKYLLHVKYRNRVGVVLGWLVIPRVKSILGV